MMAGTWAVLKDHRGPWRSGAGGGITWPLSFQARRKHGWKAATAVLLEERQPHLVLSTQLAGIEPHSTPSLSSAAAGAAGETRGEQGCSRGEQGILLPRPPEGVWGQVVGRVGVSRVWHAAEGPCSGTSALDAHFTAFACLGVVISAFNRDSHCRDFLAPIYFRPGAGLSFNLKFAGQRPLPFTSETRPCGSPGCWQQTSETLSRGHPPCTRVLCLPQVPGQHRAGTLSWNQQGHQTPCLPEKGPEGPW